MAPKRRIHVFGPKIPRFETKVFLTHFISDFRGRKDRSLRYFYLMSPKNYVSACATVLADECLVRQFIRRQKHSIQYTYNKPSTLTIDY